MRSIRPELKTSYTDRHGIINVLRRLGATPLALQVMQNELDRVEFNYRLGSVKSQDTRRRMREWGRCESPH
jgi:hypothetical protein